MDRRGRRQNANDYGNPSVNLRTAADFAFVVPNLWVQSAMGRYTWLLLCCGIELMEESTQLRRSALRLVILTAIHASCITVYAESPATLADYIRGSVDPSHVVDSNQKSKPFKTATGIADLVRPDSTSTSESESTVAELPATKSSIGLKSHSGATSSEFVWSADHLPATESSPKKPNEQVTTTLALPVVVEAKSVEVPLRLSDLILDSSPAFNSRSGSAVVANSKSAASVIDLPVTEILQPNESATSNASVASSQPLTAVDAIAETTPNWIEPDLDQLTSVVTPQAKIESSALQASRAFAVAQQTLQEANQLLQRNATQLAQKTALDSLRMIVARGDAIEGGDVHTRQLESALTAFRECTDFWSPRGPIDHATMVRLIADHDTDVLKGRTLIDLSPIQAIEAYLAFAKESLVQAAGPVREASDAITLLGQIQTCMSEPVDALDVAIALSMQRAAVQVDPSSAYSAYEFGKLLLEQGIADEAVLQLMRATEIQPSRSGHTLLAQAAMKTGNVEVARTSTAALSNPKLTDVLPTPHWSGQQFPAAQRLAVTATNRTANNSVSAQEKTTPKVTKKRSWLTFGRR